MILIEEEILAIPIDDAILEPKTREEMRAFRLARESDVAKAQLRKVVEWVIENNDFDEPEDNSPGAYYVISKNLWQALLKEVE